MSRVAVSTYRRVIHWPACLLGLALLAGPIACSGGGASPSTPNTPGGRVTAKPAPGAGGQQLTAPAPVAAPGLGTNPETMGAAAPPPTNPATAVTVPFDGGGGMPFVDPTPDQAKQTKLFFEGLWGYNGGFLEQSMGARKPSLTFRQYVGEGLGANGVAPGKYRTDVTVWVYQNSDQYADMVGAPLGILGYAPYYLDETHYLLAVAKPKALEVWAVDGFNPGSEWPVTNRLFKRDLATPLAVGVPVSWSVEVDTLANSARVWANGEEMTTVTHPLIADRGQRVALVSNGNYLHFQDFKLFRL